jgi:fibronectin-binding autotransporter adhesin
VASTGTGGSVVIRGGMLVQTGATSLTKAAKSVSIKADSFALTGKVQTTAATGTIGIDTTGTTTLTGGTITSAGGAITMGGSALGGLALDNASTISSTAGGGTLSLTSTGTITNSGTISTAGSSTLAISTLGLALDGGTISSGTGAIGINATGTTSLMNSSSITSAGGAITLGATSLADLTLDAMSSITETAGTGKTLSITSTGTVTNGGTISTTGANAVAISAPVVNDNGTISTVTGALGIDNTGTLALSGGTITSAGGAITLGQTSLATLTLDGTSRITQTAGTTPTLTVKATGTISNGGTISTVNGEALAVTASSLTLMGTLTTATGALTVNTTGSTTLDEGTMVSAGAITLGNTSLGGLSLNSGSSINSTGGTVSVTTSGALTMTGGMLETTSTGATRAGNVSVEVANGAITLSGGAEIASIASGSGGSGDVSINPGLSSGNTATLSITGTGVAAFSNTTMTGQAAYNSGVGTEAPNTGIFSISNGTGSSGNVAVITTGNASITAGGQIASIQANAAGGNAGAVTLSMFPDEFFVVHSNDLTLGGVAAQNGTNPVPLVPVIYTSTANTASSSGAVTINALSTYITMQPGAVIQTSTQDGQAGDINIYGGSLTLDSYSAIQSLESQSSSTDTLTTGHTGNILVEIFNFDLGNFAFTGPLSIAKNAVIQTSANPKATGGSPVGDVLVLAGSLNEGGTAVPVGSDGYDFAYKIKGNTLIRAVNQATLNGANGSDVSSINHVTVQNLIGFSSDTSSTPNPTPSAGNGVVLDGTLNGARNGLDLAITATPNSSGVGYTYMIVPADGTTVGGNLFLSFADFNLGFNGTGPVNETAEFDAAGYTNIIARITGGASRIDGMIDEGPGTNANLFLLNSAGFLFTANSGINLNGAFTLSTANSIQLNGGGVFQVSGTPAELMASVTGLTTGNAAFDGTVNDFIFASGTTPKGVDLEAATLSNSAAGTGQIQIISGDILLADDSLLNSSQTLLFATDSNGTLGFGAGGSLATFTTPLTSAAQVLTETGFGALGSISLTNQSVLTVPTPNEASTILIRGNAFNLTDSLVIDQTTAQDGSVAGEVLIDVTGAVTILSASDPTFISTSALGNESGGSVIINAASLSINGGTGGLTTGILSTAEPADFYTSDEGYIPFSYPGTDQVSGSAGSVTLNITGALTVSNAGQISTNTTGNGNAGRITINGGTIALPGGGTMAVLPQVSVSGGGSISSSTNIDPNNNVGGIPSFTLTGAAGSIVLNASQLAVTGSGSQIVSSAGTPIFTGATGRGGSVNINVDGAQALAATGDIDVLNGGQISASSYNNAFSGQVSILQNHSTDLADPATNPTVVGGLYVSGGGSITTAENGAGTSAANSNASILNLQVQAVTVDGGSITSGTVGASAAGSIQIKGASSSLTDYVLVENGGVISSNTSGALDAVHSGAGGTITIGTGALTINGANSAISTNSLGGTGAGGAITLTVTGNSTVPGSKGDVTVAGGGAISAASNSTGQAGNVTITQNGSLDLADPATNPTIIGGVYLNGGSISTAANGPGTPSMNHGVVMINAQALTVNGAAGSITSNTLGASSAGSITIRGSSSANAQFVRVTGGGSISSNTGGTGNGGTITIQTGALAVKGANSAISTNAIGGTGNGGNITLTVQGNTAKPGSTGDVMLTNGGAISALSLTTGAAGTVTLSQRGSTDLADPATSPASIGGLDIDDGSITTLAFGAGTTLGSPTAGNITITTQALTMDNGGSIISSTLGASKAGTISVNGVAGAKTQWVMVKGGSVIASNTSGTGAGGAITINTGALTLDGASSAITTSATGVSTAMTGGGGSITLNVAGNAAVVGATGDVAITNGGTVSSSSGTTGDAGTVTITQVGSRDVVYPTLTATTNGGLLLNDGIITTAANGAGTANSSNTAGDITLMTEALTMTGGAVISSSSAGASKAGDVKVSGPTAGANTQFVAIQGGSRIASETSGAGNGGTITMGTGSLLVDQSTLSTSATGGSGNGGDIFITAVAPTAAVNSFVTVQHGGTIVSSSNSTGAAGQITIAADRVTVTGAGAAISTNAGTLGNAMNTPGEISLTGQDLFLTNSGLISATTGGFSPGGTITVHASNEVDLETNARMDASSTAPTGGANGGSILIGSNPDGPNEIGFTSPYTVNLADNSVISCDSSNTNGGNIGIQTNSLLMDHSLISTSEPNGPTNTIGGNITINAGYTVYLNNFSFINSNAGQGTGGNITIDPQFTVLNHSGINAIGGSANGNVYILSDFVLSGTSSILATGVVDINSLPLDLTGSLLPLPANLTDEQKRLREKCARAVNHEFSSFIVVGRGGTESAPEEFQPDFGLDSLPAN